MVNLALRPRYREAEPDGADQESRTAGSDFTLAAHPAPPALDRDVWGKWPEGRSPLARRVYPEPY